MKRRRRFLVLVVLAFSSLAGLKLLDRYPVHLSWLDGDLGPEREGAARLDSGPGDVLLVVDLESVERAAGHGKFSQADWSYGWLNLLGQEAGGVRVASTQTLQEALNHPRRLIVLSGSCAQSPDLRPALEHWVRQGGVLVVERPVGSLLDWAGLVSEPGGEDADGPLEGRGVDEPRRRAFSMVASSLRLSRVKASENTEVLASWGGSPLVSERRYGDGVVRAVMADVGRVLVAHQQGQPTHDDYRMEETFGDYEDIVEPDDLVKDRSLRENELPHVDLLEAFLFDLLRPEVLPTLGRIPPGSKGIFALTHDEDFEGGGPCFELLEVSEASGVRGTFLVIPHDRLSDLWLEGGDWYETFAERGAEIGMHFNQYPMPRGVWKIEPLNLFYGTETQFSILRDHSPHVGPVLSNRNHYLIWGDHYTRMFRLLAANGIVIDSTYGANKGRGYTFGTGSAFTPIDTNGLPLPILEVPFLNQETWGGADLAYFRRMLEANGRDYHGVFVSLIHPHLDFLDPEIEGMGGKKLLTAILESAKEHGHVFMTLGELATHETARSEATVVSRWDGAGLDVSVEIGESPQGMALYVPLGDGVRARVGGNVCEELEGAGRRVAVIPVAPGESQVRMEFTD